MTRRTLPLLTAAAVAGALGLSACGGSDSGSGSDATLPATVDLVVTAVPTIRWDKPTYEATAGEIEVALVNEDTVRHDLVVLDGDTKVGDLELITKSKGETATGSITLEPGTYSIFCIVPGHAGMKSDLVVS